MDANRITLSGREPANAANDVSPQPIGELMPEVHSTLRNRAAKEEIPAAAGFIGMPRLPPPVRSRN